MRSKQTKTNPRMANWSRIRCPHTTCARGCLQSPYKPYVRWDGRVVSKMILFCLLVRTFFYAGSLRKGAPPPTPHTHIIARAGRECGREGVRGSGLGPKRNSGLEEGAPPPTPHTHIVARAGRECGGEGVRGSGLGPKRNSGRAAF